MELTPTSSVNKKTTLKNRLLLKRIIDHKYLFLVSLILFLGGAYFYNQVTPKVYMVKASLLVKETNPDQNNITNVLFDKTKGEGGKKVLADEIAFIQSYPFVYRTVRALNNRVSYFAEERFGFQEIYKEAPFRVSFVDSTLSQSTTGAPYKINFLDEKNFTLENEDLKFTKGTKDWKPTYKVGQTVLVHGNALLVELTPHFNIARDRNQNYQFTIHTWDDLALRMKYKLNILIPDDKGSILDVYLETGIPEKGIDFLYEYTAQYIAYTHDTKNQAASQTLDFIDNQLVSIRKELSLAESEKENFQSANTYSEATTMTDRSLTALSQLDNEKAALVFNERYYNSILESLRQGRNLDKLVAPSSVGIQDGVLNNLISQLVELQIEKNTFSTDGSSKNPVFQELEIKINNIKSTLRANLASLIKSNRLRLSQINDRSRTFQESVSQIPKAERKFVNIQRVYALNESVYQLLMQKKVEAGIMKASSTVENRVIEPAFLQSSVPIQPKTTNTYILAILLGLALPFSFVWIKGALNSKITSKDDVLSLTNIPVLGTIYHNTTSSPYAITPTSRTAISESFRVLRSTLNSLSINKSTQVILITSTSSGEGKTFNSMNIAASLALARKKTVLINLDLRIFSQLHKLMKQEIGISSFLEGTVAKEDIVFPTENPYLDYIATGPLPNNPAELIMDDQFPVLIKHLRASYDYIIIDSPPLGIVSDPLIIARNSDLNILVIRQNYTPKDKLVEMDQMYTEGKIKNVGIILNDVPVNKDKYQYGYFTEDKKKSTVF